MIFLAFENKGPYKAKLIEEKDIKLEIKELNAKIEKIEEEVKKLKELN
jgi:hypothetical protein